MERGWEETGFSILEWKFIDKQGEKALMDQTWSHQYELNELIFSSPQIQVITFLKLDTCLYAT